MSAMQGYKELRGRLEKKRKDLFGRRFFVISGRRCEVGRGVWERIPKGVELTVGVMNGRAVSIRPGIVFGEDPSPADTLT